MKRAPATGSITHASLPRLGDVLERWAGRGVRYARYARGTTVLRKGQRCAGAYVVMDGRLRVYTLSPGGNEATLYFIDPGETCVLALNSLFHELSYPAWVEADVATRAAVVPGPLYRAWFESDSRVRELTVQALATVVSRLMSELEQRHSYRLEQRLASLLLSHAVADGTVLLTQQRIASHLGTTREVVARLLRQLAARRLIETRRRCVSIKRPTALAALLKRAR